MAKLNVLSVVAEVYPLIKTGGLADVAGALPAALLPEDVVVTTLVPGYPAVKAALEKPELVHNFGNLFGGGAGLLKGKARGLDLLVIDAPHLFDRPGSPYVDAHGIDWYDNPLRFAALSRVAADLGLGLVPGLVPDIVHAHDWQTGLVPAYLRYSGQAHPPSVMTVHNLAFQGQYSRDLLPALGLPPQAFSVDGVEYYGAIGYLKSGLQMADRITTVSPTYAAEIRTAEGGMGLDGLLRARSVVVAGILNGVDDQAWDPASDPMIESVFSLTNMAGRGRNKQALQARLGLDENPDAQLFGVVSRLTWQKGLDLLLERLPALLATGAQLAVLGSGEPWIADGFAEAAAGNPSQIGMVRGYDEALAHQIQAGSDVIVVPSRFEPCGLTQLCALRYGALPLVARVGGLADTIIDANEVALAAGVATGFQFGPVVGDALQASIQRAAASWRDQKVWKTLQKNAMKTDVSWRRPAKAYAALYRGAIEEQIQA